MSKRRAHVLDSDQESLDDTPTPKRAHTEDEEELERKPEEQIREQVLASLQPKTTSGIAEHGIIESIEMHQFMCHKYLTFSFGPQINFIIGHNGSGKSAVLSAITVALGGKATFTGRGSGIKSFIREGQSTAEVTLSLKNQGEDAYKPEEYGKSIIITRRFNTKGSSTWKIKSRDGTVISTKKDELTAICDHMNIQVDNPMNVLTQDAARQFLGASSPSAKYKFFLRGTQLSQLSEEYALCRDNIAATNRVLEQKGEALPDLETAYTLAHSRYEEAAQARELKARILELKKEVAWAHVTAKKNELEEKINDAARAERRLPRIQANIDTAQTELHVANNEVRRLEEEYNALGDKKHLTAKKTSIAAGISSNRPDLAQLKEDLRNITEDITGLKVRIKDYEAEIEVAQKKLEKDTQLEREESQRKLEEAQAAIEAARLHLQSVQERRVAAEQELQRRADIAAAADSAKTQALKRVGECEQAIAKCVRAELDQYAPYGNNIKRVVDRIAGTRWMGETPLGPFGVHVKLREPQYAALLRNQLGGLLSSFAVTNTHDIPVLRKILADTNNSGIGVIFFTPDMFDYSRGEPPDGIMTVLRALEITDPHVLRLMINRSSIESRILADKRKEAENILAGLGGSGGAWTKDMFVVTRYSEGGESSIPLYLKREKPHPMLLGGNSSDELQRWKDEKVNADHELHAAEVDVVPTRAQCLEARRALETVRRSETQATNDLRRVERVVRELEQKITDELPADLEALVSSLKDSNERKEDLIMQFTHVTGQKANLDQKQWELLRELNGLQDAIAEFDGKREAMKETAAAAAAVREKAVSDLKYSQDKLVAEEALVKTAQEVADVAQQEFEDWTTKAEEYCERVESPRKVEDVKRIIASTEQALKERERRQGASIDDLSAEMNKAKEKYRTVNRDLELLRRLMEALEESLDARRLRWDEFLHRMACSCKMSFGYQLAHRGYFGRVVMNHELKTLELEVQTDDQAASQGSVKDAVNLSGGEKSFSTICLLLSLWGAIACPIRCLDEFDVFMDAVNRRISMKMMINSANNSDKRQYILITPQDMNNVNPGPTVRVHRMSDPERGQGVLSFAR